MCAPKESGSTSNSEISAKSDPIAVNTGPTGNPSQASVGDVSFLGNADRVELLTGAGTLYIIKAADSRTRPKGAYLGKAEFESAFVDPGRFPIQDDPHGLGAVRFEKDRRHRPMGKSRGPAHKLQPSGDWRMGQEDVDFRLSPR